MKKWPLIHTPLPGPKTRKLINQDRTYVSPSYTRYYPLVVEKAKGLYQACVSERIAAFGVW